MLKRFYKIGEVAEMLNIEQYTLRYLESALKLKITRDEKGDRIYSETDLEILKLIIKLKDKGLNTTAIKMALENIEETANNEESPSSPVATSGPLVNFDFSVAVALTEKIVRQNDELLEQNKRLDQRLALLESKLDNMQREREKALDELLKLWREGQDTKSKSWISKIWK